MTQSQEVGEVMVGSEGRNIKIIQRAAQSEKKINDFQCSWGMSHRQRRPRTDGPHNYKSPVNCCRSVEDTKILITVMHLIEHMYALTIPLKRKNTTGEHGDCVCLACSKFCVQSPAPPKQRKNTDKYSSFILFLSLSRPSHFFIPSLLHSFASLFLTEAIESCWASTTRFKPAAC